MCIFAKFQNGTSLADGTFGSDDIRFVGGRGRFEGPFGRASSQGTLDLATLAVSFTIDGRSLQSGPLFTAQTGADPADPVPSVAEGA